MATLNANKWGYMSGISSATFSSARTSNAFTVVNSPSTTADPSIGYTATSGRGSLTHRMWRSFFTFDVSGITGTVSSLSLNFRTSTSTGAYIVLESSAFNGSNSNLVASEFFSNIDYTTTYSSATTGTVSNPFSITLNSTAEADVQNNSWFICAVVQNANDYANSAAGSATDHTLGVNWSLTPYLDYTETAPPSGPNDVASLSGVTKADISNINGLTISDILSINSIS